MSTASEQKAWRGGRAANIARPAVPRAPSSANNSNNKSTAPKTKQDEPRPSSAARSADQTGGQEKPPKGPAAGNIWDQRKAAAQQPRPTSTPPQTQRETSKSTSSQEKKPGQSAVPTSSEESHSAVNGFNSSQVRSFLSRDASSFKPLKGSAANSSSKPVQKGNMANGQSFFALLNKQIAQLQASK